MDILIVGGNGGIGLAIVKQVCIQFPNARVHATFRSTQPNWKNNNLTWSQLDARIDEQVAALANELGHLDWLINCVGMLHTANKGPEKSVNALDKDFFLDTITTNALPSLLLAKYFTPKLRLSQAPKFATISAKVGSISDNQLGGWYSYRASKAALNMLLKTLSIEWQRTVKRGTVLALHPGTTDTALSAPFQSNVPQGKLFSPQRVAKDLLNVIGKSSPESSGKFLAYDGSELPW